MEPMSGCWIWNASLNPGGYGQICTRTGHPALAHRVSYELNRGPIPKGLTLDHLCRNRCCVNPDHLEAVTMTLNVLRGIGPTAVNARKTICKRGHALTQDNVHLWRNMRFCKACIRIRQGRA